MSVDATANSASENKSGRRSLGSLRCAVLGAGGFIGTNLCAALEGKVKKLRCLVRRDRAEAECSRAEWIIGDYSKKDVVRETVAGCDTVFHLIGSTTPATGNRNMVADLEDNVVRTIRALDICLEEGIERIVFASSGGTVYGIPDVVPTPEGSPTRPITSYGISKLAIEMYLELYRYHYGMDCRILRLSNPYGPHQTERNEQGVISAFLRRAMAGKPVEVWGDGSVARDFIYIEDVVDALIRSALHVGAHRTFNIGSGIALSISEVISAISKVLGREVERIYFEARPIDVARSVLDVRLAERELGWRPRMSLMKGLEVTAEWMELNAVGLGGGSRDKSGVR